MLTKKGRLRSGTVTGYEGGLPLRATNKVYVKGLVTGYTGTALAFGGPRGNGFRKLLLVFEKGSPGEV